MLFGIYENAGILYQWVKLNLILIIQQRIWKGF